MYHYPSLSVRSREMVLVGEKRECATLPGENTIFHIITLAGSRAASAKLAESVEQLVKIV